MKFYIDTYPEIFEDYNKELNGKDYTDISDDEIRDEFWWNCTNEDCRATYKVTIQRRIASRDAFTMGCPYCAGKKVLREKSFGALHEDLLDEYGAENELDSYEVTEHSSKPIIWHCRNNSEHIWTETFHEMACGFKSCRICYPYAKYDVMLCDVHPEFRRYYSDSNKRDFNTYSLYSNEIAEWKCDMGHTFTREVYKVGAYDDTFRCPVCDGTIVLSEVNSVSAMRHELIALWDCQECHGTYPMKISDKKPDNTDCPYCNNEKLLPAFNDLGTAYPELAAEWSENNPDSPSDYLRTSTHTALWACPTCYGEYVARICDRTVGDDACPYCRHKKVLSGFNDLASVDSKLASEWSLANPDKPSEYLRTSPHKALWPCSTCHGEYEATYFVNDCICPYCNEKKVLPGFNSFAVKHPDEMEEWDELANYILADPDEILSDYAKKVWWNCPHGHKYDTSPKQKLYYRMRKMQPCPLL